MIKPNSQKLKNGEFNIEETIYKYLYKMPPKGGRYIVLDTETTGLEEECQVVELGAHEIINGKLTGSQFHIYIRPRIQMNKAVINIHKISNSFYDDYFSEFYESDKQNLINFSKFLGNSLIFAHNAPFDMNAINNELRFWGMNEIPIKRFRCSMRIFMDIIGKIDIKYSNVFTSLTNCCEYFKIKSKEYNFHNALFDSFMTSKMICKIYETLDNNPVLRKKMGYDQKALDYFFIDNIVNKSKRLKNQNQINKEKKKETNKKTMNNINYSIKSKIGNNSNNKNISNINNKIGKDRDLNYSMKKFHIKYDYRIKNDIFNEKSLSDSYKNEIIKKYNSASKQNINHLKNNNSKYSIKESKSKIISTNDKVKENIKNNKEDDEEEFENELSEDIIDEIFSELL